MTLRAARNYRDTIARPSREQKGGRRLSTQRTIDQRPPIQASACAVPESKVSGPVLWVYSDRVLRQFAVTPDDIAGYVTLDLLAGKVLNI